jgi:CRISPR-associated protein Cas5t
VIRLRIKAPFAAFRPFAAGSFRPSAPFITFSAAYGLAMNIAGIETRYDDRELPMTLMRQGLPSVEMAIGVITIPKKHTIYQQLHNYPIGSTGKEYANRCRGAKYNIQPIRREFLSGIEGYICISKNPEIEEKIRLGLRIGSNIANNEELRYGIPFLGDNNHMVDILQEEEKPLKQAYWYQKVGLEYGDNLKSRCRMTIWINRANMQETISQIFELTEVPLFEPPQKAWIEITPPDARQDG